MSRRSLRLTRRTCRPFLLTRRRTPRLARRSCRPFFLTARPEWLGGRTREFLDLNKFPVAAAHTTLSSTGATGDSAAQYKSDELSVLATRFPTPSYGFGNTESDAQAYENAGINPVDQRVFFQFDDAAFGGRRIESYTDLLKEFEALPPVCK